MLRALNQKYDNIKNQNHRFLIFMGLMLPGFILMAVEALTDNPAYYLAGMVYILILGTFRIVYVEFMRKKKGVK